MLGVTALFVIPRHDVPRNPGQAQGPAPTGGAVYRRDPLKRDVAPTMNDPVNVIMTQPPRSWRRVREPQLSAGKAIKKKLILGVIGFCCNFWKCGVPQ
jgi:hypothetical protein